MRKPILATMLGTLMLARRSPWTGTGVWIPPKCDIKPGHFLVNSGVLYPATLRRHGSMTCANGICVTPTAPLTQAVTSGGQEKNPAAWYYLARYYVMRNDAVGADPAFRKAEALMPACKDDIFFYRRNALWVPAFNAGAAAFTAGNNDSAIAAFRRANQIYDAEPQGFTMLATVFFNTARPDSAAKYFRQAIQAASDPKFAKEQKDAMFNSATRSSPRRATIPRRPRSRVLARRPQRPAGPGTVGRRARSRRAQGLGDGRVPTDHRPCRFRRVAEPVQRRVSIYNAAPVARHRDPRRRLSHRAAG
jgi:hypothetical protein